MQPDRYYFAFGANLNKAAIKRRCPDSRPIVAFTLHDFELVFRSVADILPIKGSAVQGALYLISRLDELSLDRFEGFNAKRPRRGLYRKEYFKVRNRENGVIHQVMYYAMNRGELSPPSHAYLSTILAGYRDWGLNPVPLEAAAAVPELSLE